MRSFTLSRNFKELLNNI